MMNIGLTFLTLLLVQDSTQHSFIPRITNGSKTFPDQFPFMASIQMSYTLKLSYFHVCAGIVIDEYWILSTGICVQKITDKNKFRIKVDMYFTKKYDRKVQIIRIAHTILHENYDASSYGFYDMGLIKLMSAISRPRIANIAQPETTDPAGEVFMIGWGKTSSGIYKTVPIELQYAKVRILKNQNCSILVSNIKPLRRLDKTHICTFSPSSAITSCTGDSGGPIVRYVGNKAEVVGIMSWSFYPCGIVGAPTVSMRISQFVPWINEKIGNKLRATSQSHSEISF